MPTEFELSIVEHAITSGRAANCFFQSFFHTLTNLSQSVLEQLQKKHPDAINAFIDTFNSQLRLESPVNFSQIIEISRSIHPLERECLFGPILRHAYNTMIDRKIFTGDKLQILPDAIVFQPETVKFANN